MFFPYIYGLTVTLTSGSVSFILLGISLISSFMARTKNKPVLKRSVASSGYSLKNIFLKKRNHKYVNRHDAVSPLSQTVMWFEKYWLDNRFGFQPFSFDELFKSCDKTKFPWFCRNHILRDSVHSVWKYTRRLKSYTRYFYDSLIGPNRKFDIHFDAVRGKVLKTRCAMTFSELSAEVVGFVDNMDYDTGEVFSSVGYDSLYTNLAGRSTEYVIPLFGIMKFVAHQCRSPMRISRKPVYRRVMGSRYRCIQMLIERSATDRVFSAGSDVVMDYCYKDDKLPFSCCCANCVVNLVDA